MNLADTYAFTGTVSGAGSLNVISEVDVAGASSVTFDSLGSYENFVVWYRNLNFSTNTSVYLEYKDIDGRQTGGYQYRANYIKGDDQTESIFNTNANEINIVKDVYAGTNERIMGTLHISKVSSGAEPCCYFQSSGKMSNGQYAYGSGFAINSSMNGALSGLYFFPGSGTFSSGKIVLYGVSN
jgi:hypothetical protein